MTEAVCDSGPLTHLWQIKLWKAFSAFTTVHLAEQVAHEVEHYVPLEQWEILADCHVIIHPVSASQVDSSKTLISPSVTIQFADIATFSLAMRLNPDFVLTDDLTLRQVFEKYGQKPMGSVGLLMYAYKKGFLNQQQLSQAIDNLFVHSTLYLSPQFKAYVHKLVATEIAKEYK